MKRLLLSASFSFVAVAACTKPAPPAADAGAFPSPVPSAAAAPAAQASGPQPSALPSSDAVPRSPLRDAGVPDADDKLPPPPLRAAPDFVPSKPLGTDASDGESSARRAFEVGNVTASVPVEGAEKTLATARPKLEACYEAARAKDPSARGRLMVHLRVDATGRVTTANVALNTGLPGSVVECALAVLRALKFSAQPGRAPSDIGITIVMDRK